MRCGVCVCATATTDRSQETIGFVLLTTKALSKRFSAGRAEAGDDTWDTVISNGAKLNSSLAKLREGDVFVVPTKTFHLMGGIHARNLHSVTISIDGTLSFASTVLNSGRYMKAWPRGSDGGVLDCLTFSNLSRVNFTSASRGELDGGGAKWWGLPGTISRCRKTNCV